MFPSATPGSIKPFRFKSFNGEPDAEELQEQAALAAQEAEQLPPPPPVYTESDLEHARMNGFAAGKQEGYRDGLATVARDDAERQQALAAASAKVSQQVLDLAAQHQRFLDQQREVLSRIALSVARKVAGKALRQDPLTEIESMIDAALTMLTGDVILLVHVHPGIVSYMQAIYAERAVSQPELSSRISFAADPNIALPDDCRVQWLNGTMERSQAAIWQLIERTLADFDPLSTHP